MVTLYHGSPHEFSPEEMKPSQHGLYGPGYYGTPHKDMATIYGSHVHKFDVDESKFVDQKTFDREAAKHRSAKKAAAELSARGHVGVKEDRVYAVWDKKHMANHAVAGKPVKRSGGLFTKWL